MTLEEEILFFIQAKQKAEIAGTMDGFAKRLDVLYLEGQMTDPAYKILRQIFGFAVPEVKVKPTKITVASDPCSRGSASPRANGC